MDPDAHEKTTHATISCDHIPEPNSQPHTSQCFQHDVLQKHIVPSLHRAWNNYGLPKRHLIPNSETMQRRQLHRPPARKGHLRHFHISKPQNNPSPSTRQPLVKKNKRLQQPRGVTPHNPGNATRRTLFQPRVSACNATPRRSSSLGRSQP